MYVDVHACRHICCIVLWYINTKANDKNVGTPFCNVEVKYIMLVSKMRLSIHLILPGF